MGWPSHSSEFDVVKKMKVLKYKCTKVWTYHIIRDREIYRQIDWLIYWQMIWLTQISGLMKIETETI